MIEIDQRLPGGVEQVGVFFRPTVTREREPTGRREDDSAVNDLDEAVRQGLIEDMAATAFDDFSFRDRAGFTWPSWSLCWPE